MLQHNGIEETKQHHYVSVLDNKDTCTMSGSLTGERNISIGGSLSTSSATRPSSVFKELESKSWMLLLSKTTYCVDRGTASLERGERGG